VYELQRVRFDHQAAILDFEVENRAYFAESVSDRGDAFFEDFSEQHRELLDEQEAGHGAFYVLVTEHGTVVGRFNLYDVADATANVGYRVAQCVVGQGVATIGLRQLCRVATEELGLRKLTATTTTDNAASQRVLEKAGFTKVGPTTIVGRAGFAYELSLENAGHRS
jgi:ribosomal-protein-alanine N-acetyltransferase